METKWKFTLKKREVDQLVEMPQGAEPEGLLNQKEKLVVYAVVDPDNPPSPVRILVVGTGHPLPFPRAQMGKFLGAVQFAGGDHVFHVYHKPDLN